jgi:hypothetical protein
MAAAPMTVARLGALAVVLAIATSAAQARTWDFRVLLDGRPIGHHRFALEGDGDSKVLRSSARFEVRWLFLSAYRYAHDATERWRGGCLESLSARTDDGGKRSEVRTAREGARLVVDGSRGRAAAEGCVMTFAYWNDGILRQPRLLNAQTGEYLPVSVETLGVEEIAVRGTPVAATRYRITGPEYPVDLWYAAGGDWVALASSVRGGRQLRYELQ